MCKRTKSAETFLLGSAALANLTFMEPTTVDLMSRYGTVAVLVTAITSTSGGGGKGASVYVQVGYVIHIHGVL